jgi:hypothetical protein
MKTVLIASALGFLSAGLCHAASITNKDSADIVLTVAENGNKVQITVASGSTEDVCPSGCFITMPNGDRLALTGGESVEISGGSANVK